MSLDRWNGLPARRHALTAGLAGCVALWVAGCAAPRVEPKLTPEQQALNVASFDQAWETIRDTHWDPQLGGVDWEAVRTAVRPKVETASTMDQARGAMNEMIARLGKSHFGIIPGDVASSIDDADSTGADTASSGPAVDATSNGDPGLSFRIVDGAAVVTGTLPGSPAETAGILPGWVLRRVAGRDIGERLARMQKTFDTSTYGELVMVRAVEGWLEGPRGSTIEVEFETGPGVTRKMDLGRAEPYGRIVRFGHLPPMRMWWQTRTLEDGIGYFALSAFFDPPAVDAAFAEALADHADAPGFIVDLRGNPGGIGLMAMGMAGRFFAEGRHHLGVMKSRQTSLKFVINPRQNAYTGPVAVLVDGLSASTSEIYAGGLQDLHRARVFGQRTAGAALPSRIIRLPNGDALQHAVANYVSASGAELEGRGVIPDEVVVPTREALLAGRDPALEAAVAWIRSRFAPMHPVAAATRPE